MPVYRGLCMLLRDTEKREETHDRGRHKSLIIQNAQQMLL
jgi:hypothetical protein